MKDPQKRVIKEDQIEKHVKVVKDLKGHGE